MAIRKLGQFEGGGNPSLLKPSLLKPDFLLPHATPGRLHPQSLKANPVQEPRRQNLEPVNSEGTNRIGVYFADDDMSLAYSGTRRAYLAKGHIHDTLWLKPWEEFKEHLVDDVKIKGGQAFAELRLIVHGDPGVLNFDSGKGVETKPIKKIIDDLVNEKVIRQGGRILFNACNLASGSNARKVMHTLAQEYKINLVAIDGLGTVDSNTEEAVFDHRWLNRKTARLKQMILNRELSTVHIDERAMRLFDSIPRAGSAIYEFLDNGAIVRNGKLIKAVRALL